MKEQEKLHQLPTPFQGTFVSRCLESSLAIWVKYTYRELSRVHGLLQKLSWCAKSNYKQHLFE